jgi:hypothetical protein
VRVQTAPVGANNMDRDSPKGAGGVQLPCLRGCEFAGGGTATTGHNQLSKGTR